MWSSAMREKFNLYFSGVFLLVLIKCPFGEEDWALGYNSMKFQVFPDIA